MDANLPTSSGNTPLHAAVTTGDVGCVRLLVKAGVNVNAWNAQSDGATALHLAVMYGKHSSISFVAAIFFNMFLEGDDPVDLPVHRVYLACLLMAFCSCWHLL